MAASVGGDVPALKLAFEMTGDYVPRMKQTVDNTVKPGSYSADDLAAAERELEAWERGRKAYHYPQLLYQRSWWAST